MVIILTFDILTLKKIKINPILKTRFALNYPVLQCPAHEY